MACFTMTSCDAFPPPAPLPACSWVNDGSFSFSKINLKMPTTHSFYGMSVTEFITFPEVFQYFGGVVNSSNIKITTNVAGCQGTLSKSISYTSMYDDGLWANSFTKQNRVSTVAVSAHTVTIEMTSGPWTSMTTGEKGTIVWSSNLGSNAFTLHPNLDSNGTFKATVSKSPQSIYVGNKFQQELL